MEYNYLNSSRIKNTTGNNCTISGAEEVNGVNDRW